jgi:ATP-dependent DNA helicase RecG
MPMSRLLQGDVGSGKTVVAAAALLVAAFNGYQGALMAPTELLAEQHFLTLTHLLPVVPESIQGGRLASVRIATFPRPLAIGLLLGSLSRKAKDDLHRRIAEGGVDLVIGTHALLQEEVEIPRLALAVVDEQHRFGTKQRAQLVQKDGRVPHFLSMTATPIPRTLALTLYGDLDLTIIDQMPSGRKPVATEITPTGKRDATYAHIRKEIAAGRQAYVICPRIDEPDETKAQALQARSVKEEAKRLKEKVFPEYTIDILHSKMKPSEKDEVMQKFVEGKTHILVATSVVEVGVNVQNATIIVIEGGR